MSFLPSHDAGADVTRRLAPARGRAVAVRAAILTAVAVLAGACGHKTTTAPKSGVLASISVSPGAITVTVNDTLRFTATLYDSLGTVLTTDTVTWATTDSSIATITDSGTVTTVDTGTVTIQAISHGIIGTATLTVVPPSTVAFTGVGAVVAGFSHTCALDNGDVAYCWGGNSYGQLGNDTTTISPFPLAVSGGLTFSSLAAGYAHTCGISTAGQAYCWGDNESGALGNPGAGSSSSAPVAVSGGLTFTTLTAGYAHTCGLTVSGKAYCWGADESGELGIGTIGQDSPTPVAVSGGLTFASISAGGVYTCGITTGGAGYCWGSNAYGVLGDGATADSPVPVAVVGALNLASISAGVYHTCAVTTNGAAYCWGAGENGQLGTGFTSLNSTTPMAVVGGHTFVSIATGELSTCGITTNGAAYCWGAGSFGELGNGGTTQSTTPQLVSGSHTFTGRITSGISFHFCAPTTATTAYCWGYNNSGELGSGIAGGYSVLPSLVSVPNTQ